MPNELTDTELLDEIKKFAANCNHADQACALVYFINNSVNASAPWRSWKCKLHNYSGQGSVPQCPKCPHA